MRYTYDVYGEIVGEFPSETRYTRIDTFVRRETLERYFPESADVVVSTFSHINVNDNLRRTNTLVTVLRNRDDYEMWIETMARNEAWEARPMNSTPLPEIKLVDANRKTAAAAGKPKVSVVPPIGIFALGAAMEDGANKYERFNWRTTQVTSSVFFDAMLRHLLQWYCGEDKAKDSGVHHLGHMMAGGAILLDGELYEVLNDDRDKTKDAEAILKRMFEIIKG